MKDAPKWLKSSPMCLNSHKSGIGPQFEINAQAFVNRYHIHGFGMNPPSFDKDAVTLLLHDATGQPWPLRLSRNCLKFVGRYRRIEGFDIDAMVLFQSHERRA